MSLCFSLASLVYCYWLWSDPWMQTGDWLGICRTSICDVYLFGRVARRNRLLVWLRRFTPLPKWTVSCHQGGSWCCHDIWRPLHECPDFLTLLRRCSVHRQHSCGITIMLHNILSFWTWYYDFVVLLVSSPRHFITSGPTLQAARFILLRSSICRCVLFPWNLWVEAGVHDYQ